MLRGLSFLFFYDFRGLLDDHLVNVGHPSVVIRQADTVAALLEIDVEGDGSGAIPIA